MVNNGFSQYVVWRRSRRLREVISRDLRPLVGYFTTSVVYFSCSFLFFFFYYCTVHLLMIGPEQGVYTNLTLSQFKQLVTESMALPLAHF